MIITAGKFKGQKITAPDEKITRPTLSKVRMGVFNSLQSLTDFEGKSFLDMFAGSGIMGIEAFSRGFTNIVAIEKNVKVASITKSNYKKLDLPIKLLIGDSLKITKNMTEKFDIIYIDPPYYAGIYEESLRSIKNISGKFVILEHVNDIKFNSYELLKQKKYGDKYISFLKTTCKVDQV